MEAASVWLWVGFSLLIVALLLIDAGLVHREAHVISIAEAIRWTVVWIALALLFDVTLYLLRGVESAIEFLTGYLVEKSLSVDNIFVFTLIFTWFRTPVVYQRPVLFWGILGALVMRGVLIVLGATLLERFDWIIYIFGGFLLITGVRLATEPEIELHPEQNPLLRLVRRFVPVTSDYEDGHFFIRRSGITRATPLFLVLVLIESSDLIFAVDSIPAVFAVTRDPFIVYTSNVFAILGLRSLYFVLAGVVRKLAYLNEGLAVILVFVGAKMLLSGVVTISAVASLGVVVLVLALTIVASLWHARSSDEGEPPRVE